MITGAAADLVVFVAELHSSVVGYGIAAVGVASELLGAKCDLRCTGIDGRTRLGYLKSSAVTPRFGMRRRGIGTELLMMRLRWMVERGVDVCAAIAWPFGCLDLLLKSCGLTFTCHPSNRRYHDGSFGQLYIIEIPGGSFGGSCAIGTQS
jgi:hypothetical protein